MKQLNNTKSEVYLSTYDNSGSLLPVSEEHEELQKVCVAVKFGDIVIKISPKETCKCTWDEAVKIHAMNPAYWQMVGNVYYEVNQAIEMLGHDPINWVWTDTEDNDPWYSSDRAWNCSGTTGIMYAILKSSSNSVREAKVFKINE